MIEASLTSIERVNYYLSQSAEVNSNLRNELLKIITSNMDQST